MSMENPNMDAEIIGHDKRDCGVKVVDERGHEHRLTINWDGAIREHGGDEGAYPHEPEDRTEEEQRIMSQVEERARYEAQREFEDADILDPMWDPEHVARGIDALADYQLEDFHDTFRDFYEALADPVAYAPDAAADVELDSVRVYKAFTITPDNRVDEIDDAAMSYELTDGSVRNVGRFREPDDSLIVCLLPPLDFAHDFDYHEQFHEIVVGHLVAQIRDLYLHMGEEPPDEYKAEGIGKLDIHGDGIGET